MIWLWLLLVVFFAVIARLLPHWLAPLGYGVDHWFWKAYIETYRKTGEFPPKLPQFLLDEEQWYPPLFPLLAAYLPPRIFDQYGHVVAVAIDLVRMILMMGATVGLTGDPWAGVVAGMVYAATPILITYNMQLNPRGLGALGLDLIVLGWLGTGYFGMSRWLLVLVAFFAGLVLLTHKMTTQLFWFLCLIGGILTWDWRPLAFIPGAALVALIISRGFYLKVLRAHWDILSFWNRNWPWLTAHPILESPIYGRKSEEGRTGYFAGGVSGFLKRIAFLGGFNPWGWGVLGCLAAILLVQPEGLFDTGVKALGAWLTGTLLFVVLTTFLPFMRFLGNGYLYVYNAGVPAAMLVGLFWSGGQLLPIMKWFLGGAGLASLVVYLQFLRTMRSSKTLKVDDDLQAAIDWLKEQPDGIVLCYPIHWHDLVAYKTGKAVLFGGHGYGFQRLQPFFPRLMEPIRKIIEQHRVRYLLSYEGYLPDSFLAELPPGNLRSFGQYRLYAFP